MDPKKIVRSGYDRISYAYRSGEDDPACASYHGWLDELEPLLPGGGVVSILELGCGCGNPVARRLAEKYVYTGVDLSPVQIERARQAAPRGTFVCQDMSSLEFPPASFDAVLGFFSLIHVPVEEQPGLLGKIAGWLKPGGWLMATVGWQAWTGQEEDWLGARMYWSHASQETYLAWLSAAGLREAWTRFLPEGDGGHVLALAQKGSG